MFKCRLSTRSSGIGLLFLVALLSGSSSADISPQAITAFVTETVILPCRITVDGELPTLEWSKEKLSPNITLLYRDGCETFGMKNPAFLYRTNLFLNELKDGNISQIIYNLRLSDRGRYQCRTLRGRQWQVHAVLDLNVGAVSEPKLRVVPAVTDGGGTLECKAECWYPEPEITLHDDEGNEVKAENPTRTLDTTECFTVTRKATNVQTPINRVTCRVHETTLKQTKTTEIYIPDQMGSCLNTAIVAGITTFFLTSLILCGIAFILYKKFDSVRQCSCLTRNGNLDQECKTSDEDKIMLQSGTDNKSEHSNASQQDQSTQDPRSSINGTEQLTPHLSCNNRSTGSATSKKKYLNPVVSRQDKTQSPLTDRPKASPAAAIKDTNLLRPPMFHRSLSYRSDGSGESESLIDKPQNQNN